MIITYENVVIKTSHIKGDFEDEDSNAIIPFELIITENEQYGLTNESIIIIAPYHYKEKILEEWNNTVDA